MTRSYLYTFFNGYGLNQQIKPIHEVTSTDTYYVSVDGNLVETIQFSEEIAALLNRGFTQYEGMSSIKYCGGKLELIPDIGWVWDGGSDMPLEICIYKEHSNFKDTTLNNLWERLFYTAQELTKNQHHEKAQCALKLSDDSSNTYGCSGFDALGLNIGKVYYINGTRFIAHPGFVSDRAICEGIPNISIPPVGTAFKCGDIAVKVSSFDETTLYFTAKSKLPDNSKITIAEAPTMLSELDTMLSTQLVLTPKSTHTKTADYLTGIATCARYTAGKQVNSTETNSLSEIVELLERYDNLQDNLIIEADGNGNVLITGGSPNENGILIIPGAIHGSTSVKVVYDAFKQNKAIKAIVLQEGVTEVAQGAFYECNNVTQITLPESLTFLGSYAFNDCHGITHLHIPSNLVTIENNVFGGCESLVEITCSPSNPAYYVVNNCLLTRAHSPRTLVQGANTSKIPQDQDIVVIAASAFEDCRGLTWVNIPDTVTEIERYAFNGCTGLTTVMLPASVKTLGAGVFSQCTNLSAIYYEDTKGSLTIDATDNDNLNHILYYYSETQPTTSGNYWHAVDGNPEIWPPVDDPEYSDDWVCHCGAGCTGGTNCWQCGCVRESADCKCTHNYVNVDNDSFDLNYSGTHHAIIYMCGNEQCNNSDQVYIYGYEEHEYNDQGICTKCEAKDPNYWCSECGKWYQDCFGH